MSNVGVERGKIVAKIAVDMLVILRVQSLRILPKLNGRIDQRCQDSNRPCQFTDVSKILKGHRRLLSDRLGVSRYEIAPSWFLVTAHPQFAISSRGRWHRAFLGRALPPAPILY